MPNNGDLKIELEPQNPRKREREHAEFPKTVDAFTHQGFRCLDYASTEPYSNKERKGLSPNANMPKRWD
jgi:hypothetical protein